MARRPFDEHKRRKIWRRDQKRCRYCKRPLSFAALTIDHVVARSRGGSNRAENLVASCLRCNSAKGDADRAPIPLDQMPPPERPTPNMQSFVLEVGPDKFMLRPVEPATEDLK